MSEFKNKKINFKKGFSLLEMVIYISILVLVLVVVVNMTTVIILSQKKVASLRVIEHSSGVSLDRMTREIKDSLDVDIVESVFGVHPGKLVLDTTDLEGNPKKIEFYIDANTLILKDGLTENPLTDAEVSVTNLVFQQVTENRAKAIRMELTLEAGAGEFYRSEDFLAAALIRNAN